MLASVPSRITLFSLYHTNSWFTKGARAKALTRAPFSYAIAQCCSVAATAAAAAVSTAATVTAAAASTAAHVFTFFGIFYIFVDYVCTISKDQNHYNNICQHFTHPLFIKYYQSSVSNQTEAGHISVSSPLIITFFIMPVQNV